MEKSRLKMEATNALSHVMRGEHAYAKRLNEKPEED
jgi:hypothetical protein